MHLLRGPFIALLLFSTVSHAQPIADMGPHQGTILYSDDFQQGTEQWVAELEQGGKVAAERGELNIEVPSGCTVWFKPRLEGPVLIEYEVTVIGAGGRSDRVSDLNCFWMANDVRSPDDIFGVKRSGKFSDYDELTCYYVGLGGNGNFTTRFRRYIGQKGNRPILPEHDLSDKEFMITPNVAQKIQIVADGSHIAYYRNGKRLFDFNDPQPYTKGWFALRTTTNHMTVRSFRVYRLDKNANESPERKM